MYQDDDIFDVGPILGKGMKEFREDQARGKDGKWVDEGKARQPKGRQASGKKPTSKPKSTAKPKSKPAAKPKAPAKKPAAKKPKAEAKPASKPRAKKPKQEVTPQEPQAQAPQQQAQLAPEPQQRPVGLVERDKKALEDAYARYDAANSAIDEATKQLTATQAQADRVYSELKSAGSGYRSHRLNSQLNSLDDEVRRISDGLDRRRADRDALLSTINELDRRLRGQKRYIAKLFAGSDTAIDFRTAFNKIVPDNGQPAGGDAGNPLGLVFGWAIVCKERGRPYFDTQGDHIPEESMLKAATDFMLTKRDLKVMHKGKRVGTVVFAWPVTKDIAKAMGLDGTRTGLMIGVKPDSPTIVDRFRDGQYTGFSIGGNRLVDEPVT